MKNVIKKIASIAMAFVLLGTGIAVTKVFSPKSDNTIVATAASKCTHNCRWYKIEGTLFTKTNFQNGIYTYKVEYCEFTKCYKCNSPIKKPKVLSQKSDLTTKTNLGNEKVVYGDWLDFYDKHYVSNVKYASKYVEFKKDSLGNYKITKGVYVGETFILGKTEDDGSKHALSNKSNVEATFSDVNKIGSNLYSAYISYRTYA